jgi:hypothetical protein
LEFGQAPCFDTQPDEMLNPITAACWTYTIAYWIEENQVFRLWNVRWLKIGINKKKIFLFSGKCPGLL